MQQYGHSVLTIFIAVCGQCTDYLYCSVHLYATRWTQCTDYLHWGGHSALTIFIAVCICMPTVSTQCTDDPPSVHVHMLIHDHCHPIIFSHLSTWSVEPHTKLCQTHVSFCITLQWRQHWHVHYNNTPSANMKSSKNCLITDKCSVLLLHHWNYLPWWASLQGLRRRVRVCTLNATLLQIQQTQWKRTLKRMADISLHWIPSFTSNHK